LKILIINLHSSRNVGDAALALVSVQLLKAHFSEVSITLAMNDPTSHSYDETVVGSFLTWFMRQKDEQLVGWHWAAIPWLVIDSLVAVLGYRLFKRPLFLLPASPRRALLKAYFEADLIVSCPGNMLLTLGRFGLPLLVSVYAMIYARLAGKPLYMLPQSIGPLKRRWERALIKWILGKMRLVLVREPVSYAELAKMGMELAHCHLAPDIAFAFSGVSRSSAKQFLAKTGVKFERNRPLLGITVINWEAQNWRFSRQSHYEAALSEAIRTFITRYKGRAILFPQVWGPTENQDDRIPARRIVTQLNDLHECVILIEDPVPPQLLKSSYGLMDIFIGTRMHSNIFALSEGVPVLAIGYLYKTRGMMQMLQLDEWVLDINEVNGHKLASRLEAAWLQRNHLKVHIQQQMPSVTKQIQQAIEMIASDFTELQESI
jgi:colanic acid/amylovoran biosynthesis protein